MSNPWLNIPASDYEGHMNLPEVDQLSFLATEFKQALKRNICTSVAYFGCATGNGIEYIDPEITKRLTVIDLNPEYLEILRSRYRKLVPHIEIVQADLNNLDMQNPNYDVIFASLIFEYLEPFSLLQKITSWLSANGKMIVILQQPDINNKIVSETPYKSLNSLKSIMKLHHASDFITLASQAGLVEIENKNIVLKSGKTFYIGTFQSV